MLGLVGRDLLLDIADAVADEDAAAAFELAGRAVEIGLRPAARVPRAGARWCATCWSSRSIRRASTIRRSRAEGERERLPALAARFSREDLLRAFDVLTQAETDIRARAQPRYHLEMALLRWIHLRKLVPIEDLIAGLERGGRRRRSAPPGRVRRAGRAARHRRRARRRRRAAAVRQRGRRSAVASRRPQASADARPPLERVRRRPPRRRQLPARARAEPAGHVRPPTSSDALPRRVRKAQEGSFYSTVVAQAQRSSRRPARRCSPSRRSTSTLRAQFEQPRAELEAARAAGRRPPRGRRDGCAACARRSRARSRRPTAAECRLAPDRQALLTQSGRSRSASEETSTRAVRDVHGRRDRSSAQARAVRAVLAAQSNPTRPEPREIST